MSDTQPKAVEANGGSHVQPRGLGVLLWSTGVSALGDGAFVSAAPLLAVALTSDPELVAVVWVATYAPWLLVGPFAGALIDRCPRRGVLIAADAVRGVGLALLALLVVTGHANIGVLSAIAFLIVAGQSFADGASQAVLPSIVGRETGVLTKQNGRIQSLDTAGRSFLGPPAGSAAFALAPALPFLADAVSFVASAAILAKLPQVPRPDNGGKRVSLLADIGDGMRYLFRERSLVGLACVTGAYNLGYNLAFATFVLYAKDVLGVFDAGYGLLLVFLAVGGVCGGWIAGHLATRFAAMTVLLIAVTGQGAAWSLIALVPSPWLAGPMLAVVGVCSMLVTVAAVSTRQALVPDHLLGRVVTSFRLIGNGLAVVGAALGGIVASTFGLRGPLDTATGLLAISALLMMVVRVRRA